MKDFEQYTAIESEYAGKFTWNVSCENGGLNDPDDYKNKTPEEILKDLFERGE